MDVLEFSKQTKKEAAELLQYGEVIQTLSKYGEVVVGGSYKYDLMYGPDIDLSVMNDNPEEASYSALKDFLDQRKFQKYQFGDFQKFPRENRPKAMIVVLIHEFKGRRWEIEIWFDDNLQRSEDVIDLEKLLLNVTSKQKEAILNIKDQREKLNSSKLSLSSVDIYKGVLVEGKTNIKDFGLNSY